MKNFTNRKAVLGFALALLAVAALSGCTRKPEKRGLWIYTSIYNQVIQDLHARLAEKFPDTEIQWYQAGSENVAAKLNAELLAGKPQADLVLTSDPFWYEDLKKKGYLLAYESPAAKGVPPRLRDAENFYATVRLPVMVIAYHADVYDEKTAPKSFAELAEPKFKDKVAMPSPLESGTAFTTVAMLTRKLGWDYVSRLRANGALSAGGNSAVLGRVETKERPVGIVLLENILTASKKNPKLKAAYPSEGAVLIPSPIAILKSTSRPEISKGVYDFFFSREAQDAIVRGDMYSPLSEVAAPPGARPFVELMSTALPWDGQVLKEIHAERESIKRQFSKLMLE